MSIPLATRPRTSTACTLLHLRIQTRLNPISIRGPGQGRGRGQGQPLLSGSLLPQSHPQLTTQQQHLCQSHAQQRRYLSFAPLSSKGSLHSRFHHTHLRPVGRRRLSMNPSSGSREPRRFAPLDSSLETGDKHKWPQLKGIIFDVDGTLWYSTSAIHGPCLTATPSWTARWNSFQTFCDKSQS